MNNYTTIISNLKRKIVNFSKKCCKDLSKPINKFVTDMIYGIVASKSIMLSDISRSLKEEVKINQTIDRLSENLVKYDLQIVHDNYLKTLKKEVTEDTLFCIDDSDVIKPNGTYFENMGMVRDGSSKDKKIEKGYHVNEIVMINKGAHPKSVYSNLYSEREKCFISKNMESYDALDKVIDTFGNVGTYILDRGFDGDEYYKYFINSQTNFIIRSKKNRKVIYKNKKRSIDYVINNYKGRIAMDLNFQDKDYKVSVSHTKIKLLCVDTPLNLVVVHGMGKEVFKLITNREIKGKEDVIQIVRDYISRWRIEEYFKFKKQQFGFENFRVRNLKGIRNLNTLLSLAISVISDLASNENDSVLVSNIKYISNGIKDKVIFWLYRISEGIYQCLNKATTGVKEFFKSDEKRYDLFSLLGIPIDD